MLLLPRREIGTSDQRIHHGTVDEIRPVIETEEDMGRTPRLAPLYGRLLQNGWWRSSSIAICLVQVGITFESAGAGSAMRSARSVLVPFLILYRLQREGRGRGLVLLQHLLMFMGSPAGGGRGSYVVAGPPGGGKNTGQQRFARPSTAPPMIFDHLPRASPRPSVDHLLYSGFMLSTGFVGQGIRRPTIQDKDEAHAAEPRAASTGAYSTTMVRRGC